MFTVRRARARRRRVALFSLGREHALQETQICVALSIFAGDSESTVSIDLGGYKHLFSKQVDLPVGNLRATRVGSSMFFSWLALLRLTEPSMACFGRTGTCFCCGVCGASTVPVHCPPQTNQILKKKKKNPPGNSSEARRRRGTAPCVGDSRLHF